MKNQKQSSTMSGDLPASIRTDATQRHLHNQTRYRVAPAVFTLVDGYLSIVFKSTGEIREGDTVELYAGDHFLNAALVEGRPDTHDLICNVPMHHSPPIIFPASVRAVLPRLNEEIPPGLTISTLRTLQASMGRHGMEMQLASVQDTALGFDVTVKCLPAFPRALTMHLGGRVPSNALSQLPKYNEAPDSLVHSVVFPLHAPVRDGMSIEIVDDATGSVIFETTLTWMNLINPLLAELRNMHQQQEALTKSLDAMGKQMLASADPGRERLMLQRLDLTYLLLNERLDREVKWLSSRIDGADAISCSAEQIAEPSEGVVHIEPSGLQGVGIYDSESNGVDTWRWFSRTVTLFLTKVDSAARKLRFRFAAPTRDLDFTRTNVSSNGYEASFEWAQDEGRMDLVVGLSSLSSRPDRTLIVTIDFAQAWNAENDSRLLTLACLGLDVEA